MSQIGEHSRFLLSRRQVLKMGAVAGGSLILPLGLRRNLAYAADTPTLTRFVDPLPKPRVFSAQPDGSFLGGMQEILHEVHTDLGPVTTVWAYGDQDGFSFPGPTFEARKGQPTRVRWLNMLAADPNEPHRLEVDQSILDTVHGAQDNRKAVVHLHGGHVTQFADGYPEDTILPTQEVTYDYNIDQEATTLWYHDHALGNTRLNVMMGLAGFFLVRDDHEDLLISNGALPAPAYEYPVVIQDRRIKENGQFSYDRLFDDTFFGNVPVVNGKAWPYLDVQRRKYRFRLLNGSNTRTYTLRIGDGDVVFHQIGSDGGLLNAPIALTGLTLTPGERADIVIDFAQFDGGDEPVVFNTRPSRPMEEKDEYPIDEIMQFRVQFGDPDDTVTLPATLRDPIERLHEEEAVAERDFKLEDKDDPRIMGSEWQINGLHWDDVTEEVQNDTVEIWNWVNKSEMIHPMHIHLVQFQVLERYQKTEDGTKDRDVDENEMGWKDTVRVGPKETVRVIARFKGQRDDVQTEYFPYHCHVLEHEDHEMMRQFRLAYY